MTSLAESLYAYLVGWPALNLLVGASIYPTRMPQAPRLPAIVFHLISRRPIHVKTRVVYPVVAVLVQFDVLAATYAEVDKVSAELKRALYDFAGIEPWIYAVMVEGERDGDEVDLEQFHRSVDCSIWLSEE